MKRTFLYFTNYVLVATIAPHARHQEQRQLLSPGDSARRTGGDPGLLAAVL